MMPTDMATADPLEQALSRLLQTIPETWVERDVMALTATEERAVFALTAAGMIERRAIIRLVMFGHPTAFEATITTTGEGGIVEALGQLVARTAPDWAEEYEKRRQGEGSDRPSFHSERYGAEHWRLTDQGVKARDDLQRGDRLVLDFILKRGFWGAPGWMADGEQFNIGERPPVYGFGALVTLKPVRTDDRPVSVNVSNFDELVPLFEPLFARHLKPKEAPARDSCTTNVETATRKRRGRPASNPERDDWMIRQKEDGKTLQQILEELRKHKEWEQVEDTDAISKAISRRRDRLQKEGLP